MDNAQGGEPSTGAGGGSSAADARGDWRSNLRPEARGRIVDKIMTILKKLMPAPASVPEVLAAVEVRKLAERYEEKIFAIALSQNDYLRKISLKMLSLETHYKPNKQENPRDVQVVQNKRPRDLASRGSTSHIGSSDAGDLKEELSQMFPGQQGMDNTHEGEPSTGAGAGNADAGGDWRSELQQGIRSRIVNRIMETLEKHLPVSVPEGLSELRKIAVRFEEKIFAAAVSQEDYLRKISLKMLTMESQNKTNTQENPHRRVSPVQALSSVHWHNMSSSETSRGSTGHIGSSDAVDLKEDLSQMNKMLKDQYLAGLGDLYETYIRLGTDNPMPTQGPIQVPEQVNFKLILERSLDSVQISKKPVLEKSTPMYKREILSLINSEEWLPGQKLQQSAGQALGTSSSGVRAVNGMLSLERGNTKRLRLPLKDNFQS